MCELVDSVIFANKLGKGRIGKVYEIPKELTLDLGDDDLAQKVKSTKGQMDIVFQRKQSGNMQPKEEMTTLMEVMTWTKWVGTTATV